MFVLPKNLYVSRSFIQVFRQLSVTVSACTDYYAILSAKQTASSDEIKKLYLKKCKEYHPDKHQGDKKMHDKFIKINEAYETLSDTVKRRDYDRKLQNPFASSTTYQRSPYSWGGSARSNPEDVWREQFRQKQQYSSRNSTYKQDHHSYDSSQRGWSRRDPLNDYWEYVYKSNNFNRANGQRRKRSDTYANMSDTYAKSYELHVMRMFIVCVILVIVVRFKAALYTSAHRSQVPDDQNPFVDRHYEFKRRHGNKSADSSVDPNIKLEET